MLSTRLQELSRDPTDPDGIAELVVTALGPHGSFYICWKTPSGQFRQDSHGIPEELREWLFSPDGSTRDFATLQVILGPGDGDFLASDSNGRLERKASEPAPTTRPLDRTRTFRGGTVSPNRLSLVGGDPDDNNSTASRIRRAAAITNHGRQQNTRRVSILFDPTLNGPNPPAEDSTQPAPLSLGRNRIRPKSIYRVDGLPSVVAQAVQQNAARVPEVLTGLASVSQRGPAREPAEIAPRASSITVDPAYVHPEEVNRDVRAEAAQHVPPAPGPLIPQSDVNQDVSPRTVQEEFPPMTTPTAPHAAPRDVSQPPLPEVASNAQRNPPAPAPRHQREESLDAAHRARSSSIPFRPSLLAQRDVSRDASPEPPKLAPRLPIFPTGSKDAAQRPVASRFSRAISMVSGMRKPVSTYVDAAVQTDFPDPYDYRHRHARDSSASTASTVFTSYTGAYSTRRSSILEEDEEDDYCTDDDEYYDDDEEYVQNPIMMGRMSEYFRGTGYSLGDAIS